MQLNCYSSFGVHIHLCSSRAPSLSHKANKSEFGEDATERGLNF